MPEIALKLEVTVKAY